MAYQYLAFRGRDESNIKGKIEEKFENGKYKCGNPGNFLCLDLDCPVLKEHCTNCPKNNTYTSK